MATSSRFSSASELPTGAVHPIAPARLNAPRGKLDVLPMGVMIWLASELMFFAALFAAYFTIREVTGAQAAPGTPTLWESQVTRLALPFASVNTVVLVLSSVTCQLGVHRAERGQVGRTGSVLNPMTWGMREWYMLTFAMGAFFVGGQVYEYFTLFGEGINITSNAYWSAFFLATGFHGLHVFGGLIAFLFVLGRSFLARRFTHEQAVNAMVVSYYWHFVDLVWIVLFSAIYLIR